MWSEFIIVEDYRYTEWRFVATEHIRLAEKTQMLQELEPDGLPVREVSPHSIDKSIYVAKYINAFTTAMRERWEGNLVYMDPFAGPGRCRVKGREHQIPGSPLIALGAQHPFSRYYFGDDDPETIETLQARLKNEDRHKLIVRTECGDAHNNLLEWIENEGGKPLVLAYLDPEGLDVKFETMQALVTFKSVDVIQNVAIGTSIRRNLPQWLESEGGKIDAWYGGNVWRGIAEDRKHRSDHGADIIVHSYVERIKALGFLCDLIQAPQIRSHGRNLRLYRLLLASKNPLALKIWGDITSENAGGQRRLRFDG